MHMDITPYIEGMRRDLLAAARAAGEDGEQFVAERLSYAIDASARLAIMEAVSAAAAEITAKMPSGSVDVRLVGRDLDFAVQAAMPTPPPPPAAPPVFYCSGELRDFDGVCFVCWLCCV